jgi:TetR/AcrR family transcriptional regulator
VAQRARKRPSDVLRDPDWTKAQLLEAARLEFSEKGLSGARVNDIAARARVNKQLLYYYFGDKEGLYGAVLKRAYEEIRVRENELDLAAMPPAVAMERFIGFTFDYLTDNRYVVALLIDENFLKARHVRGSLELQGLHARLTDTIGGILARGEQEGVFRGGIDPIDLYISIASPCYFYYSNIHTLTAIFGRNLSDRSAIARRRQHVIDFVSAYLGK